METQDGGPASCRLLQGADPRFDARHELVLGPRHGGRKEVRDAMTRTGPCVMTQRGGSRVRCVKDEPAVVAEIDEPRGEAFPSQVSSLGDGLQRLPRGEGSRDLRAFDE